MYKQHYSWTNEQIPVNEFFVCIYYLLVYRHDLGVKFWCPRWCNAIWLIFVPINVELEALRWFKNHRSNVELTKQHLFSAHTSPTPFSSTTVFREQLRCVLFNTVWAWLPMRRGTKKWLLEFKIPKSNVIRILLTSVTPQKRNHSSTCFGHKTKCINEVCSQFPLE